MRMNSLCQHNTSHSTLHTLTQLTQLTQLAQLTQLTRLTQERSPLGASSGLVLEESARVVVDDLVNIGLRRAEGVHHIRQHSLDQETVCGQPHRHGLSAKLSAKLSATVSHCQPSGRCRLEQVRKGRGRRAAARTVVGVLAHGLHVRRRVLRAKAVLAAVHHRVVADDCTTTDALSDSSTEDSCSPL